MTLAIFDLDHTLLQGDSDYAWGEFLVEQGAVDEESYKRESERYYSQYQDGTLDILEFLSFALRPLGSFSRDQLNSWRETFMREKILPMINTGARELVNRHRSSGDTLLIITATNGFVASPIANEFGIEHLLATEPEVSEGRYTGRCSGTPCFREGKVERLQVWLDARGGTLMDSWFYSDSHNDLPLLNLVTNPVAVHPDPVLAGFAGKQGWPIINLW